MPAEDRYSFFAYFLFLPAPVKTFGPGLPVRDLFRFPFWPRGGGL